MHKFMGGWFLEPGAVSLDDAVLALMARIWREDIESRFGFRTYQEMVDALS